MNSTVLDYSNSIVDCSRLDYYNSLLYNVPTHPTDRLQRLQKQCARIVTKSPRREHITPVLNNLGWLKIQDIITYKILMLTYQSYCNMAPPYLCELINKKESHVNTRLGMIIISLLCHQLVKIVLTLFLNVHSFKLLHANGTN